MKIYIARHGQTDLNKQKVLQGSRTDHSLNETGIKQAEELSKNLSGSSFDIIFSSTLKRAKETAEIVNKKFNVPLMIDERLVERDFGNLSGRSWEQIKSDPSWTVQNEETSQNYDYSPFGGETSEDVKSRLLSFLENLKKEYQGKKILIISHGGVLKFMQRMSGETNLFTPENGALYDFEI
jgi:broad specificity phosphatase PhoE